MKKFYFIIILALSCISYRGESQSSHVLPGNVSQQIVDRWDILYDYENNYSSTLGNMARKEMMEKALYLQKSNQSTNPFFIVNLNFILTDNSEYLGIQKTDSTIHNSGFVEIGDGQASKSFKEKDGIFGYFYKTDGAFYEVNNSNFRLKVNPIINFQGGKDTESDPTVFQNTRGIELRGTIDDKIYFYSNVLENQARFYNYLERRINRFQAIPGNALYKSYESNLLGEIQGWDYLNAQAYLGYNLTKSVSVELGHGRHFIGDGIRSLLLSDYAHNAFYLKFNTKIWKFNYQNLFTEISPISGRQVPGDFLLPKKYTATHFLSYSPTSKVEFGLFESVVFSRADHFEFQYLNPVILYRTVEQFLDSPDNALIGLTARWNVFNQYQIYSQLILDEFKIKELTAGNGWWGNKYGIQLGLKALNIFNVDQLDFQYEYNTVRPYTYTHRGQLSDDLIQSVANYSHYNQPLAHPLGANFREHIVNLSYRPTYKLNLNARLYRATYGRDEEGAFYGNNILIPTTERISNYDNETGQGIATEITGLEFRASYMIFHNLNIDLTAVIRNEDSEVDDYDVKTQYFGLGLRYNISAENRNY